MGLFSRKKKSGEIRSASKSMNWRVIPDSGNLSEMIASESVRAMENDKSPVLLFTSSFDDGSNAIRKFRDKMSDSYAGIYIVEISATGWDNNSLIEAGFKGVFPVFIKIDNEGKSTDQQLDGSAWGDDTLENMQPVITQFLQN